MTPPDSNPLPPIHRLGYDSRVVPIASKVPDSVKSPTTLFWWRRAFVTAVTSLPGLVLSGAIVLLVPSLLYALVEPWFGGYSTTDASATAFTAAAWAVSALTVILILRRHRNRNRRHPGREITERR